jgi:hypothetical protein
MAQGYFLAMVLGVPLLILLLAMLAAALYRGSYATLLDWRLTRSPQREAELQRDELDHMLAAQNHYRRKRGAPERSMEQVIESSWAYGREVEELARRDED